MRIYTSNPFDLKSKRKRNVKVKCHICKNSNTKFNQTINILRGCEIKLISTDRLPASQKLTLGITNAIAMYLIQLMGDVLKVNVLFHFR